MTFTAGALPGWTVLALATEPVTELIATGVLLVVTGLMIWRERSWFFAPGTARHTSRMAYDQELAHRIREITQHESGIAEKEMFGGLAFLIGGNMAVAASGQGGLMVRSDPARADDVVDNVSVTRIEMRGRPMAGWLRVGADACDDDDVLRQWVEHGLAYAASLPPK